MTNQQLTTTDQIKNIETRSGVAFELDVTNLASLAERAKAIESVDDENFAPVKKELQQARKYVSEYMMDARREFNQLAKGVIEVEKMILDQFKPEEDRLIALDKAEKERVLKEARLAALPKKRERIDANGIEFTDEEILALTDADFELEFATRLSAKAEAEAEKVRQAAAELERKQAEADRIEQARKEERDRAEREAEERIEREKREAEEAKKREAEAEAKRIADEKFQSFLTENKYNEDTDIIDGNKIYRLVATYTE